MSNKKEQPDASDLKEEVKMDAHQISLEDLLSRLGTNVESGLSTAQADEIFARDGPNALTPPRVTPEWIKFCKNLFGGFALLLWVGAFLCYLAFFVDFFTMDSASKDNLYLGICLMTVVIVTGCFQYYQEGKSSKIIESFKNMVPPLAVVRRNGEKSQIPAEKVVVGDIVEVKGGDRVPADIRIVEARGFKVDNSSLTGESEAQSRSPECTSENPLETRNLAFYSTNAVEGVAVGVVIQIGDNTVMGKIAHLTSGLQRGKTPIALEIDHFIHIITGVAFFVGISMFIIALLVGSKFLESIVFLISMIVANVPEGLIATVCVCLTLTAKRMARNHCLVKNLEAVETLGSTSTICSDKTGTLTQNHMTVSHVWRDKNVHKIHMFSNVVGEAHNMFRFNDAETALIRICALCNRADFKPNQEEVHILHRKCIGDASEVALLQYAELQLGSVAGYRLRNPKLAEIPFNSTNKFQVSIHDMAEDDKGFLVVMKGAPERIVARCATILVDGEEQPMNDEIRNEFNEANHHLGSKGERVLGFCDMHLDRSKFPTGFKFHSEDPNFPLDGLRFVGLVSMIDPPREGVPRSVLLCQEAGIRVVMVTGDHPVTAQAIATKVHIIKHGSQVAKLVDDSNSFELIEAAGVDDNVPAIVVHGEQLAKLTPEQQDFIVANFSQVVFSRTSPAQKLSIVESYQRAGNIVAVTGDGVNDAPALRKADIGIAMGISGTEVSKQAADMILMNDNFASIVLGIEEGRIIFDNLKKSIAYTLTSNIPEITPFLFHVTLGIPLPMTVIGILCIDLGTDLLPGISLAYEEAESDIMKRPPRNAKYDRLVNWRTINFAYLQIGILQALAAYSTYFFVMWDNGFYPKELLFVRNKWLDQNATVLDSFNREWNYEERRTVEKSSNTAFFFAVVVVQWVDLIISKTRKNSLLTQRLTNQVLNFSLILTIIITMLIMYAPYLKDVLRMSGLRLRWTLVAVPFAWFIFLYDETRRFFIRRNPEGVVAKFTYY